ERGHDGVDKLNDAVPMQHAYPLQGSSDEVTVVRFALQQCLLQASVLESLTRRDATLSSSRLHLGLSERRRGGYMRVQRRGTEHHSNGPSICSTAKHTIDMLYHGAPGRP